MYIHLKKDWPKFKWDYEQIAALLSEVSNLQGRLLGRMEGLGFKLQDEAVLETVALEILKNHEIEGELLNNSQVKSSIARKLGIDFQSDVEPSRYVDGVVEMMLDATQNYSAPLSAERLFDWHAALFPTGRSGMFKTIVADWRKEGQGPMQVVSGAMGKEKVHFEAPSSERLAQEMQLFFDWFNSEIKIDSVLKAAIAHLWFITIHPFDDGNGRITRAITDMQLARSDKNSRRFYSMSAQILLERKGYYQILEKTQKGFLDITEWILWFLNCLKNAIIASESILEIVLKKARFWNNHQNTSLNDRQRKMINKLFDNFKGKLFTSKWAKMCKCSKDTALRDIQDLEQKGILQKEESGGRSTSYTLIL